MLLVSVVSWRLCYYWLQFDEIINSDGGGGKV